MEAKRRVTALILLSLIAATSLQVATAQPQLYIRAYQEKLADNILLVKTVPPSSILVLTSHGRLIYRDLRTGEEHARSIGGRGVGLIVKGDTAIVALASGGVYELELPSLRVKKMFSLVKESDEVGISLIAVSDDLRYVAASLNILYKEETVNRLVVYDVETGRRLFVRDPYSSDKLFKIFSVDFSGNYLIIEDIDELCELCELTDNLIEVYSVTPQAVTKVSSLKTGLTVKYVSGSYILAQRVQENPATRLYKTMLLSVPSLTVIGSVEMGKAKRLLIVGSHPMVLAQDKEGGYRLYRLSKSMKPASSIHLPLRVDVGYLGEDTVVVYTLTSAKVYTLPGFNLVYTAEVDIPAPDYVPSLTDSSEGVSIARYDGNMYVALYVVSSVTLRVRVVSDEGPVSGAHVVVSTPEGGVVAEAYTGSDGVAVFTLKPGDYVVSASKSGFTESPPLTVFLGSDKEVSLRLVKRVVPFYSVTVRVYSWNSTPLRNALIKIRVNGTEYSAVTGKDGTASFMLPPGNYTIEISAPGHVALRDVISVNSSAEYNFTLQQPRYSVELTVEAPKEGDYNFTVTLERENGEAVASLKPGETVKLVLQRGLYRLATDSEACKLRPDIIIVKSNQSITVHAECEVKAAPLEALDTVLAILSEETLEGKKLNYTLRLPSVEAPNGTPVDLSRLAQGKVLVIEFFYTKCTGCRYLLPTLKKLSAMEHVQVVSLTVSPADTEIALENYVREHGISWPVLRDTAGLYQVLNVTNYPTVAVYYEGRIVYLGVGSRREIEELTKKPQVVLRIISAARAVLGKDMKRLPEILILAGLVLFFVSISRGGGGAEQEDEGEDKGVLLGPNIGDFYSVHRGDGSHLHENIPVDEEEPW